MLLLLLLGVGRLFGFLFETSLLFPLLGDWFCVLGLGFFANLLELDCLGLGSGLEAALPDLCLPVLAAEYSGCGGGGW